MILSLRFFLVFLLTILIVRLGIWIATFFISNPDSLGLTLFGFRMHHYMYGIVLILLSFLFKNIFVFSVGLGLFVDELTYLLLRGKTHADNYSVISLIGTLFWIVVVFFLRQYLVIPFS